MWPSQIQATNPDLDSLRWHSRALLVFAEDENDQRLSEQARMIETHAQGFAERDLKVFRLTGSQPEAQSLRRKLRVDGHAFSVVLVGKDGSVKLRKHAPLSADDLFKTIDAMPMRQEETRERR